MIIYLAGNLSSLDREELLKKHFAGRLFSFVWHGPGGAFENEFTRVRKWNREEQDD
jgi:hypothetical protein